MNNLIFLCAQPATFYYAWQVEVMINNFIQREVPPNKIHIVCSIENEIPIEWQKMVEFYKDVNFFFYNDTRKNKAYISSIRPNIIKQHFNKYTELENKTIFYHDCDIAFTKPINQWITEEMVNDDNWYGSDCRWYISHSYIKSKGDDVLKAMCKIVDIDESTIEENELNGIGAQYIMKRINYKFWENVENDSNKLYKEISILNNTKKFEEPSYHELQIWCADMWAVLWNAWKLKYKTICHPNLEFSWATSAAEYWDKCNIFHNAGVVNSKSELFFKSDYLYKLPYNINLYVKKDSTSYYYWQIIKEVGKNSVLK